LSLTLISITYPARIGFPTVFPTLGTPNILIRTDYHHSNLKSRHTYSATQFLVYLTPQTTGLNFECLRTYCCLYALHRARGISMTSFVMMFIPARYPATIKRQRGMFRAQFGLCSDSDRLEEQQSCKPQI